MSQEGTTGILELGALQTENGAKEVLCRPAHGVLFDSTSTLTFMEAGKSVVPPIVRCCRTLRSTQQK